MLIIREECFCGNTLKLPKIASSSCSYFATGSNDIAGGPWALSVYAVKYMGCYQDASSRSLDGSMYIDSSHMTAIACVSFCVNGGYLYAGIEVG